MSHPETRVYKGDSRRLRQYVPLRSDVIEGQEAKDAFEKRDLLVVEKDNVFDHKYVVTRNDGTSFICDPSDWNMRDKSYSEHLADELERITGKAPITIIWR